MPIRTHLHLVSRSESANTAFKAWCSAEAQGQL